MNETDSDQNEPSMEDILASIRRILSEDDDGTDTLTQIGPADADSDLADVGFVDADQVQAATPPETPAPEKTAQEPGPKLKLTRLELSPRNPPRPETEPEATPKTEAKPQTAPEAVSTPKATPKLEATPDAPPEDAIFELTPAMAAAARSSAGAGASARQDSNLLSQLATEILNKRGVSVEMQNLTMEAIVREALRPLLREWLDAHLPELIERLVRKEIEQKVADTDSHR